jgi:hypothetical protein
VYKDRDVPDMCARRGARIELSSGLSAVKGLTLAGDPTVISTRVSRKVKMREERSQETTEGIL